MVPYIEIKNLSLGLKNKPENLLVRDISFKIKKGGTLGIVGESGSGKTLSAMSIAGLLPPMIEIKSGNIFFNNNSQITDLSVSPFNMLKKIRGKAISVIFQEPLSSLNPSLRCGYQVGETITNHQKITKNEAREKVIDLFAEVDLPDPGKAFKSFPFQLSGGQQQRVMIAMAIANNPDFIIADEPTTALDVLVQKKIIRLLKSLQQKFGMGIIFISHDIDLVAELCDQVIVMNNGEIIEKGEKNKIIYNPVSVYTQKLIKCKPRPDTPKPEILLNRDKKNNPMLEVKKINVFYHTGTSLFGKISNSFHAVQNVSFNVFKGETLGLVGGSGSGKSTIGKSIISLIDHLEGEIVYKGTKISNLNNSAFKQYRKKIQLIFQDPYGSLNPKITVGDAITEVLLVHKICENRSKAKARVISLLKEVKLDPDYSKRYPHELSGGQRQRVVIARSLAVEPELIICDESVSALDVSVQAEILNLLNELKVKKDLTYIFISHDLSVVKYMSDRIIVLNQGKIEEISDPEALFKTPKSAYAKQLLDAMVVLRNS